MVLMLSPSYLAVRRGQSHRTQYMILRLAIGSVEFNLSIIKHITVTADHSNPLKAEYQQIPGVISTY